MKVAVPAPSPLPTAAPSADLLAKLLELRQDGTETCGYVDGNPDAPVTCDPDSTCWIDPTFTVQGCCSKGASCDPVTSCLDATEICDNDCQANTQIIQCPSASPYCFLQIYDDRNYAEGCTDEAFVTEYIFSTASDGAGSGSSATFSDDSPAPSASQSVLPFASTIPTSTANDPGATAQSGSSTSPSTTPASSSSGGISGVKIAEIVAPTVVGLALIGVLIWLLVRYTKRRREGGEAAYIPPTVPDHAYPGFGGNSYDTSSYGVQNYDKQTATMTESAISSPTVTSHMR